MRMYISLQVHKHIYSDQKMCFSFMCEFICVCVCVCACVLVCREGHSVPEESSVADTVLLDSQQLIAQDDHTYSTVDDTQGQMFMVSSNPAYGSVAEHSGQPVPQDDHTYIYCAVDSSQQETIATSENPGYGISLRPATSAK